VLCDSGTRHLSKFWKRVGEMEAADGPMRDAHEQDLWDYLDMRRPGGERG